MSSGESLTDVSRCLPPLPSIEGTFGHNLSAAPPGFYQGCTPSQGPTETFHVNSEKGYVSWDLINAGGVSVVAFSVDEHPMWVYAADGRYIQPMKVDALTITNGQRYSVFVKLDHSAVTGGYTIRTANTGINQILNATATMAYSTPHQPGRQRGPSVPYIDITGRNTTCETTFLNESKIVPFPITLPSAPDFPVSATHHLRIDHFNASYRWVLGNDESYPQSVETETPALFNRSAISNGLTISTRNDTWVDLIFTVTPLQPPHPIHKHSNKFFVIGTGQGSFNYSSVAEAVRDIPGSFNFKTPQVRDTFATPAAAQGPTWLAIRYRVVNPGAFLIHCHIQVHLAGGMALGLLDGVDAWPEVPGEYLHGG